MPVNAAEMVRRQYPARTPLADFFNSLLVFSQGHRWEIPELFSGGCP